MFRRSGFEMEIERIAEATAQGDQARGAACISDRMIDEIVLVGPVARCKERLAAFPETGVDYPIIAHQAVEEDSMTAARRLIEAFGPC